MGRDRNCVFRLRVAKKVILMCSWLTPYSIGTGIGWGEDGA